MTPEEKAKYLDEMDAKEWTIQQILNDPKNKMSRRQAERYVTELIQKKHLKKEERS
jgi:hypothetical protein